jgi:hypothetical protein
MNARRSALALPLLVAACGGQRFRPSGDSAAVTRPGVLTLGVNWVKDKGDKYDAEVLLRNERDAGVIVKLADMRCFRGPIEGELKHTFFNTGERTIDLRAHEQKTMPMVCKLGGDVTGYDFRIRVGQVFDNPGNDGSTTGKVLAKDLEWKFTAGHAD